MYQAIIIVHILLGLSIIGLILMQQGKGADAGATFGGGASGSVFGAQGAASFLSRTTALLATFFFITSLALAWMNGNKSQGPIADIMSSQSEDKSVPDPTLPNVDGSIAKESAPPAAQDPASTETTTKTTPNSETPAIPAPAAVPEAKPAQAAPAPPKAENAVVEEQESELTVETPSKSDTKKGK